MNDSTNNIDDTKKKTTLCLNNKASNLAKQKINEVLSGKQQIFSGKQQNVGFFNSRRDHNIVSIDNRTVLTMEEENRRVAAANAQKHRNSNRRIGLESASELIEDVGPKSNRDASMKNDISGLDTEICKSQKDDIIAKNDNIDPNPNNSVDNKVEDVIFETSKISVQIDDTLDEDKAIEIVKNDKKDIKIDSINDKVTESIALDKSTNITNPLNTNSQADLSSKQKTGNDNKWSPKKDNSKPNNINNNSFSRGYSNNRKKKRFAKPSVSNIKKHVELDNFALTLRDFAIKLSASKKDIRNILHSMGVECADNDYLSKEMIELIAYEFGTSIIRKNERSTKDEMFNISHLSDDDFCTRPPIVTIMGHVDHGKTTLLDSLRNSSVVLKESGGITQHIGAYQITSKISGGIITFIDTPGHEAFTSMRVRGAQITDIVVLVVAADDGVKEQTIEAINHALASKARIIVAINKIDKPDVNIDKLKGELLQHGIVVESYGGDIQCVEVSAKDKINLDGLEEAILLEASMIDLKVPKNFRASGVILESRLDKKIGNVATFLLKQGTMKVSDLFFVGKSSHGKVKNMKSFDGSNLKVAFPSMPVEVTGLISIPIPGDEFFICDDEKQLKKLLNEVNNVSPLDKKDNKLDVEKPSVTLDMIFDETESKEIRVLVKADMRGSLEAIIESINKMNNGEVDIKILHQGVGSVTQSDLMLAKASDAIIFAFRVKVDCKDKLFDNVKVFSLDVIYSLTEELERIILGMNKVIVEDEVIAVAEVKQVFNFDKVGMVAGCFIKTGNFLVGAKAKLYRDSKLVYTGKISSLRRFKDIVKEVKAGFECGVILDKFSDIKPNDVIETVKNIQ